MRVPCCWELLWSAWRRRQKLTAETRRRGEKKRKRMFRLNQRNSVRIYVLTSEQMKNPSRQRPSRVRMRAELRLEVKKEARNRSKASALPAAQPAFRKS